MRSGETRRSIIWRRTASAWGPVVLYMAAIFFSSAQPNVDLEGKTVVSDKTIHALAYLGLTLVAYRAALLMPLRRRLDPLVQAAVIAVGYGIFDEVHQYFVPGRNADIHDWLADLAGASIAVAVLLILRIVRKPGGMQSG